MSAWTVIGFQENSGAANITFSNIPQTYTDLLVLVSERANVNDVALYLGFNGSGSSYSIRRLQGSGSTAIQQQFDERIAGNSQNANFTANTFSNTQIYIPNYTGATNKSWSADSVLENNGTSTYMSIVAGIWNNTSAITSLEIRPNGGTLQIYSSVTLYGITKGSSGGVTVS